MSYPAVTLSVMNVHDRRDADLADRAALDATDHRRDGVRDGMAAMWDAFQPSEGGSRIDVPFHVLPRIRSPACGPPDALHRRTGMRIPVGVDLPASCG